MLLVLLDGQVLLPLLLHILVIAVHPCARSIGRFNNLALILEPIVVVSDDTSHHMFTTATTVDLHRFIAHFLRKTKVLHKVLLVERVMLMLFVSFDL